MGGIFQLKNTENVFHQRTFNSNQSTPLAGEYDIITHFDVHQPSKWVHEDISLAQNKVST